MSSTRYTPLPVPDNVDKLPEYLNDELRKNSETIGNIADGHLDKVHVAPAKPRAGDIRYADGTDWNPGQGENLYYFDGTIWRAYAGGSGAGDFIQVANTGTHSAAAVNTAYGITWNSSPYSQGISVDGIDTSKLNFTRGGKYYMNFSCLLHSNNSSTKDIWIFPRINGVDIEGSTIKHTLSTNNHERTLSKSGIFNITAGDYLQAMFAVNDTGLELAPEAATAFAPASPSATLSIIQVSQ